MKIEELKKLTNTDKFEMIACNIETGEIMWAVPIPGRGDLEYTTDASGKIVDIVCIEAWEDAWEAYVAWLRKNPDIPQTPKKTYRTKKDAAAAGAIEDMPDTLAIPSTSTYQNSLSMYSEGDKAHLIPLDMAADLHYEDNSLYFPQIADSRIDLHHCNTKVKTPPVIDLPLLRALYTVILHDIENELQSSPEVVEKKLKSKEYENRSVTISIPKFLRMIGHKGNYSNDVIKTVIDKIKAMNAVMGYMKTPHGEAQYMVMAMMVYDGATNTITVSSPYLNMLTANIIRHSFRLDRKGYVMTKKSGAPLCEPAHSYLLKADITKCRNKVAVEIVTIITIMIEQAGDNIPRISAQTIIDRMPDFAEKLQNATPANRNNLLKRAFGGPSGAWALIRSHTRLLEVYQDIQIPDAIPTYTTLKMVFTFPHKGKKRT